MLPAYNYVVLNVTLSSMLPLYSPIIITIFLTTYLIVKKKENRK